MDDQINEENLLINCLFVILQESNRSSANFAESCFMVLLVEIVSFEQLEGAELIFVDFFH